MWHDWESHFSDGPKKLKRTLQGQPPRQSWLIDFASLFKDTRPIRTSPSPQPWLVQRNKKRWHLVSTNEKWQMHKSFKLCRVEISACRRPRLDGDSTGDNFLGGFHWWHCAKTDGVFFGAWTHSSFRVSSRRNGSKSYSATLFYIVDDDLIGLVLMTLEFNTDGSFLRWTSLMLFEQNRWRQQKDQFCFNSFYFIKSTQL